MTTRYTLIVGTRNWSSWSLRPYLALRHIGVPFAEELIHLRRDTTHADLERRTPAGRVPVLEIEENGSRYAIWDSLAILETLAERHPEAGLWPDDARARAEARSLAAEMHSGFADVRDQLTMNFARALPAPQLRDATNAQIARIVAAWSDTLSRYGTNGGFLFGRFSAADCMYAPVVSRFRTYGIALPPALVDYSSRIFALPAMQDWKRAAQAEIDAGLA
ncbi:MAG: glutathione S-transferase [Rhizomicrobium sp.]